jgi:hypothetical protein
MLHLHTPALPQQQLRHVRGLFYPAEVVVMSTCKKSTLDVDTLALLSHLDAATLTTMSSTTTTQTQTRTRQTVLRDYELHHSTSSPRTTQSSQPALSTAVPVTSQNPPDWPTAHRRVPLHRPINRDRDQSEVRVYTSPAEQVFVGTMFTGVFIYAVSLSDHI